MTVTLRQVHRHQHLCARDPMRFLKMKRRRSMRSEITRLNQVITRASWLQSIGDRKSQDRRLCLPCSVELDGAEPSAVARRQSTATDALVLAPIPCHLVRGLIRHAGQLLVSHKWIRFEPEPDISNAQGDECPADLPWIRDGDADKMEIPMPRAWKVDTLREVLPRRYLLRRVALELFFTGSGACFLTFESRYIRRRIHQRLLGLRPPLLSAASHNVHFGRDTLERRHQQVCITPLTHDSCASIICRGMFLAVITCIY